MIRVGIGYDVHRLVKSRPLILGGIKIEWDMGLEGHSDADVIVHAIIDALLGAAGKGDIGRHFPDTDPSYKDADSIGLLVSIAEMLIADGFIINNVDVTLLAEKPKISPYIEAMEYRIAAALQIDKERVNIKATTTEGLGFCGRGEGMAAYAVASIEDKT